MITLAIDAPCPIGRLQTLEAVGRDEGGRLCRLAGSDADGPDRDLLCQYLTEADPRVEVDRIGNVYGIWSPEVAVGNPELVGSHIDTVIDARIYDAGSGVSSGLAVIEAMEAGHHPKCPVAVVAFTNEEGVRYAPAMMGSLVVAGGLEVDVALAALGTDGTVLDGELARNGYAGPNEPEFLKPRAYVELHVKQGPVL